MEKVKEEIIECRMNYLNILSKLSEKYNKIEYYVSVSTLKVNEDIIGFFFNTIEKNYSKDEACLRLYGLLQALFVSIDSIYTLSVSLTNSKNFVRINDNKILRELKYIRNDVVGHPTNRIVSHNVVYCILNPSDITKYSFKYHIYFDIEDKIREVSFLDVIYNYYSEAYKLLESLYNYQEVHATRNLSDDIKYMVDKFQNGENVNILFREFKSNCEKIYSKTDSRIRKKIELLQKLNKLPHNQLNNFTYQYHLVKLYYDFSTIEHTEYKKIKITNIPIELKQLRRLFKKGRYDSLLDILKNHNNPSFNESLNKIISISKKENLTMARLYFEEIRKRISKNMYDEAYALEAILKLV